MAFGKGRVISTEGNKIMIDTTPKVFKSPDGKTVVGSSWSKAEMPKVGAIIRFNFHNKDKVV